MAVLVGYIAPGTSISRQRLSTIVACVIDRKEDMIQRTAANPAVLVARKIPNRTTPCFVWSSKHQAVRSIILLFLAGGNILLTGIFKLGR